MPKYELNRDVTLEECPWLDEDLPKGTIVYECWGYDYGCVDHRVGEFVTFKEDGSYPGFEIPKNAIEEVK